MVNMVNIVCEWRGDVTAAVIVSNESANQLAFLSDLRS
jgi:hypothetical protein